MWPRASRFRPRAISSTLEASQPLAPDRGVLAAHPGFVLVVKWRSSDRCRVSYSGSRDRNRWVSIRVEHEATRVLSRYDASRAVTSWRVGRCGLGDLESRTAADRSTADLAGSETPGARRVRRDPGLMAVTPPVWEIALVPRHAGLSHAEIARACDDVAKDCILQDKSGISSGALQVREGRWRRRIQDATAR